MKSENREHAFIGAQFLNFNDPITQRMMEDAMRSIELEFGRVDSYPIVIGGKEEHPVNPIEMHDPSDPAISLGYVSMAGREHVDRAVETAEQCYLRWRPSARERKRLLERAALNLEREKFRIMASMLREGGKPWCEFGDPQELIDFPSYYASEIESLEEFMIHDAGVQGEENFSDFRGCGPMVALPPFNFASITGEKLAAGLAVGNPVILKPPEQTPITAYLIFRCFLEAGYPPEALAYLPGRGDIGEMLVRHSGIAHVSFTGSTAVGLEIGKAVLETPGRYRKTCDLELGGVNSAIICASGLTDEAIDALIVSTFGYAGQKCSKTQFLIFAGNVPTRLRERLRESVRNLLWGPPKDGFRYGPVIDRKAHTRLTRLIAEHEAHLLFPAKPLGMSGYFVPPAMFKCDADLWRDPRTHKEAFGPVAYEVEAKDIEEAVQFANLAEYQTTVSVWSRDPREVAYAVGYRDKSDVWVRGLLRAPNVYWWKLQTGAVVDRQPFGKTGTVLRLRELMRPQVVSKNLMLGGVSVF